MRVIMDLLVRRSQIVEGIRAERVIRTQTQHRLKLRNRLPSMAMPLVINPESQMNSRVVVARINRFAKLLHRLVVPSLGVVSYRQIEVRFVTAHTSDPQRVRPQCLTVAPVSDLAIGEGTQRCYNCYSRDRKPHR